MFINAIKAHVVLFFDSDKEEGLTSLQPLLVLRLNHTSLNRSYSHTSPSASQAPQPPPRSARISILDSPKGLRLEGELTRHSSVCRCKDIRETAPPLR